MFLEPVPHNRHYLDQIWDTVNKCHCTQRLLSTVREISFDLCKWGRCDLSFPPFTWLTAWYVSSTEKAYESMSCCVKCGWNNLLHIRYMYARPGTNIPANNIPLCRLQLKLLLFRHYLDLIISWFMVSGLTLIWVIQLRGSSESNSARSKMGYFICNNLEFISWIEARSSGVWIQHFLQTRHSACIPRAIFFGFAGSSISLTPTITMGSVV